MNKPLDVLKEWMNGVNTADVEKLANLYNKKAFLIPTFSNRLLNTPEKIREYFEKVGEKEQLSISLHENTLNIQELGDQLFSIGGLYKWQFAIDGELLAFEARFTYVFDLKEESPILHHHSSQIPRSL